MAVTTSFTGCRRPARTSRTISDGSISAARRISRRRAAGLSASAGRCGWRKPAAIRGGFFPAHRQRELGGRACGGIQRGVGMSYLTLHQSLNMNKVTISFWFRVPKETAAAVRAKAAGISLWENSVFIGVVPLLVWGAQQNAAVMESTEVDSGAIDESAHPIVTQQVTGSHAAPLQPSAIGVYVNSDSGKATLDVHIQTSDHASGTNLATIASGWTGTFAGIDIHTGKPVYNDVVYT